jgi:hypothetical protein
MTQSEEKRHPFRMPIEHLESKEQIGENIKQDLELDSFKDGRPGGLYSSIMPAATSLGKETVGRWSEHYTTDRQFIKDSQTLITKLNRPLAVYDINKIDAVKDMWDEIQDDENFRHNFHFVEHGFAQKLNESPLALEILSLYNLSSPVLSLLMPIFFLIIPFFVLQFKGVRITVSKYIEVLQDILSKHAIGKLLSLTSDISWEQRIYIVISFVFYGYQVYQNVLCCTSFYSRMKQMHDYIFDLKAFATYCTDKMGKFCQDTCDLKSYAGFRAETTTQKESLEAMVAEIENITPFSNKLSKLCEIGDTMSIFYNLHVNERYDQAMRYGMHFIGYLDNLSSISIMHKKGRIAKCKLSKGECKFTGAYYAPLHDSNPVSNTYSLDENMIITGPNASGKTTLLKTTLFNLLFTQQCGLGFYKKATINPYSKFHCYLNIPDTSARDSLFQAEARRCKEILDSVENSSANERHFCIFDELYSGTNPYEAVASSHSLLEYLSKTKCTFLLTTHFLELCHKLDDLGNVSNCQMGTKVTDDDTFVYEYKLKKGISEIKGGLKILKGLDYPEAILSKAKESLGKD